MRAIVRRICARAGCTGCTKAEPCGPSRRQVLDEHRGSARERGYDSRWDKARKGYLAKHPLCTRCERRGRVTAANAVDHTKPHRGAKVLFWNSANWQALCDRRGESCHEAKTARENGAPCHEHGVAVAQVFDESICRDCGKAA